MIDTMHWGDSDGPEAALLAHHDFLRRLAGALVRDSAGADDLVQETWLASLGGTPKGLRSPRAWLARVMLNRHRSQRRRESGRSHVEERAARPEAAPEDTGLEQLEMQRTLLLAIEALPPGERGAIVLRYHEDLSPVQIAEREGVSPNTIKGQLRRGLGRLRTRLDEQQSGDRAAWIRAMGPLLGVDRAPNHAARSASALGAAAGGWLIAAVAAIALLVGASLWLALPRGGTDPALVAEAPATVPVQVADASTALASASRTAVVPPVPASDPAPAEPVDHSPREPLEGGTIVGQPYGSASLLVRDARSHAGIPVFTLFSVDLPSSMRRDQGTFETEDGRLGVQDQPGLTPGIGGRRRFQVWAPGYAMTTLEVPAMLPDSQIVIDLEPGQVPRATGHVLDGAAGGAGVLGAEVALCAYRPLAWQLRELTPLVETTTDARGYFELSAGAGKYILRVRQQGRSLHRYLQLPEPEPVTVDLASGALVTLRLSDTSGSPVAGHVCILRHAKERSGSDRVTTDAKGEATFLHVEPGPYEVSLHGTMQRWHNLPLLQRDLVLTPGESRALELVIPSESEPRLARLVLPDGADATGWSAMVMGSGKRSLAEPNGDLDIDLGSGSYLEIRGPSRQTWTWTAPPFEPDEGRVPIHLPETPYRYRGRLVHRGTGEPLTGASVVVSLRQTGQTFGQHAVRVDDDGNFEIALPENRAYSFTFEFDGRDGAGWFQPHFPPSTAPFLELAILPLLQDSDAAGLEFAEVQGSVKEAEAGPPWLEAYVNGTVWWDDTHGRYSLWLDISHTKTDSNGAYSVRLPVADGAELIARDKWARGAREIRAELHAYRAGETLSLDLVHR